MKPLKAVSSIRQKAPLSSRQRSAIDSLESREPARHFLRAAFSPIHHPNTFRPLSYGWTESKAGQSRSLPECRRPPPPILASLALLRTLCLVALKDERRSGSGNGQTPSLQKRLFKPRGPHLLSLREGRTRGSEHHDKHLTRDTKSIGTRGSLLILDAPTMASCIFFFLRVFQFFLSHLRFC